ncbi:hypothetical protein HGRIS_004007 [Hohenbuehelia grisea]|uniref:Uncharacterized protein n=1 Tax=Hohenbuehelia grisea TaxID=104357 RepID=A0ABR3JIX2_9AGAR
MSRKAPTPVRSIPSSGFVDTMAASQQSHIDQLVQQNRTLQTTIKKLKEELATESSRGKAAVQALQQKQNAERVEWQDGCDTILACHRLEHYRAAAALDRERLNVLNEQDNLRKERLARLQRDFKLTMFQQKEAQLERRIWELEDSLGDARAMLEEALAQQDQEAQSLVKALKRDYAVQATDLAAKSKALAVAEAGWNTVQEELNALREAYAHLESTSQSTSSRLERTMLQLDGAKTAKTELQKKVDELNLTVTDLKRQMTKWENLETRGGEEVETQRKARIELEVRVKQLEGHLDQATTRKEEFERALAKEKAKVEKAKDRINSWMEDSKDKQGEIDKLEAQVDKLEKQSKKLQKQAHTSNAESDIDRAIVRTSRNAKAREKEHSIEISDEPDHQEDPLESEVSVRSPSPAPALPKASRKRAAANKPPAASASSKPPSTVKKPRPVPKKREMPSVEVVIDSPKSIIERKGKGKGRAESPVLEGEEDGSQHGASDVEAVEEALVDRAPARSAKAKGKAKAVVDPDSDIEIIGSPPAITPAPKRKGRGKAKADDTPEHSAEEVEREVVAPKPRKGKRKAPDDDEEDEVVEATAKPPLKKRGRPPRSRSVAVDDPPIKAPARSRKPAGGGKAAEELATKKAKEKEPVEDSDSADEMVRQPKKKRKINIFTTTTESTAFNFLAPVRTYDYD